jgi:DNA-binding GntR family transcriptional regulator
MQLPAQANISDAVQARVRGMIVDGALPEGARINEVHLAQELGVSRTPLREALNRLTVEGALTSSPRIGFFVRPLTLEEFQQIYAIRPLLDPEALRLAGVPAPKKLERLERLNDKLSKAAARRELAIALDDQWHLELVDDCPNRVLIELIENNILRTRRYELALMRESENVARATDEHARILAALRNNNLKAACAALKQNMQSGFAPIAAWLQQREQKAARSKR